MTLEELQAENAKQAELLADLQKQNAAILAKNDELMTETKAAKAARKEAEAKAAQEAEELLKKSGDVSALEKSWQEKLAKQAGEYQTQIESLSGNLNGLLIDNVATKLASDLAIQGSADLLMPHIKSRLATEMRDGKFVTVVRDAKGQPSALTVDELAKEFTANPAFAPVLVGSKATGGSAAGSKGGGATVKAISRSDFNALDHASRAEHVKTGGTVTD
jgi:hypothetical protein